uniref:Uncharacterized protein n=1 Tax=Pithovirus LCPAC304 TaxID=2506594 RepID=A0A481Z8T1_9VIRU|nr:MAG: hypothetical protein LCPAC304_06700 [Pithovirus LCPAC304]
MTLTKLTIVYGIACSDEDLVDLLKRRDSEKFEKYQALVDINCLLKLGKEEEWEERSDEYYDLRWDLVNEVIEVEGTTFQIYHFPHDVEDSNAKVRAESWVVGLWVEKISLDTGFWKVQSGERQWVESTRNWKVESRERRWDHLDHRFRKYIRMNAEPKKYAIPNDCACCS